MILNRDSQASMTYAHHTAETPESPHASEEAKSSNQAKHMLLRGVEQHFTSNDMATASGGIHTSLWQTYIMAIHAPLNIHHKTYTYIPLQL